MRTYAMSDIHGCCGKFLEMLEKINFSDNDVLYVLGDILERGKNQVKLYLVNGHTLTAFIEGNPRFKRICRQNNRIAINSGASMGGRLGCLRIDGGAELYVECE